MLNCDVFFCCQILEKKSRMKSPHSAIKRLSPSWQPGFAAQIRQLFSPKTPAFTETARLHEPLRQRQTLSRKFGTIRRSTPDAGLSLSHFSGGRKWGKTVVFPARSARDDLDRGPSTPLRQREDTLLSLSISFFSLSPSLPSLSLSHT